MAEFDIKFQSGDRTACGINGLLVEEAIDQVVDRIKHYNKQSPCRQNSLAIQRLQEANNWLLNRSIERKKRNLENEVQQ